MRVSPVFSFQDFEFQNETYFFEKGGFGTTFVAG